MDMLDRWAQAQEFLIKGGPAIWAIAILSVLTLALIAWKIWRLALMGAFGGAGHRTERAVRLWQSGAPQKACDMLQGRRALRASTVYAAMQAERAPHFDAAQTREEIERIATGKLTRARSGLRALELIATIAPLLGLLGTVLGMIAAFQTLQEAGSRADPAALAGGIWEALLTTAAGMAVAIPASAALTWFEAVADRAQADIEDAITRILTHPSQRKTPLPMAAE
jgi:biopolymer transport protein ExbB